MFDRKKDVVAGLAWAFAFGAVAGAVAALLLAPMTGKKMQRKLTNATGKVMDKVDDFGSAVRRVANA